VIPAETLETRLRSAVVEARSQIECPARRSPVKEVEQRGDQTRGTRDDFGSNLPGKSLARFTLKFHISIG
jgi:hypothetical protein